MDANRQIAITSLKKRKTGEASSMPPKKSKGEQGSSKQSKGNDKDIVDTSLFTSDLAFKAYHSKLKPKGFIRERHVEISNPDFCNMVNSRQWQFLTRKPAVAVAQIVREFYANAIDVGNGNRVKVRGRWVSFSKEHINALLGTPEMETTDYATGAMYEDMAREICIDGTTWTVKNGTPSSLPTARSRAIARAWFYVILAYMNPSSHHSTILKDKAYLLFAIITGRPLNVGSIISTSIRHYMRTMKGNIPHPFLITALCFNAGVKLLHNDVMIKPPRALSENILVEFIRSVAGEEAAPVPPPGAMGHLHVSQMSLRDRIGRLEQHVNHLDANFHEFANYIMQWGAEMGRRMNQMMNIDPTNSGFPQPLQLTPFNYVAPKDHFQASHATAGDHDSDEDGGDDGDDDDGNVREVLLSLVSLSR